MARTPAECRPNCMVASCVLRVGPLLEGEEFLAGLLIPLLRRVFIISAGQMLAVRAEGHVGRREGATDWHFEAEELLAGLRIPHLHLPSVTAGQAPAVRAEGHA